MADLPLAGLTVLVNGVERMQVVNNVDNTVGYAVTVPSGKDSVVRWEFTWASEAGWGRRQLGGRQYASISLLAVKGADVVDMSGKVPAGFQAAAVKEGEVAAPSGSPPKTTAAPDVIDLPPITVQVSDAESSRRPDTTYLIVGTVGLIGVMAVGVYLARKASRRRPEYQQLSNPQAESEINDFLADDGVEDGDEPDKLEVSTLCVCPL
ncbi:hypothetical protein HDU93_006806 [Gonapodya sp. JEL0774]|nr:hypothetical protein HDU93_006806 [Gonapodya sp. JEL0774]